MSYNGKWLVRIPTGKFMQGIHRFKTKRAAKDFRNNWQVANGGARPEIYKVIDASVYQDADGHQAWGESINRSR